jgi:hypothetical protein
MRTVTLQNSQCAIAVASSSVTRHRSIALSRSFFTRSAGTRHSRIEPAFNLQKRYRVARGWVAHFNFERSHAAHRVLNPTVLRT